MSRASKLIFKWGLVVLAVALALSLASPNITFAREVDDGPIVGTEPEVQSGGDNDGIAGIKIRYKDMGIEGDDYSTDSWAQESSYSVLTDEDVDFQYFRLLSFLVYWVR